MKIIKNKQYQNLTIDTPEIIEHIQFEQCTFGPKLVLATCPSNKNLAPIIRNCNFINCTFIGADVAGGGLVIHNAFLEDLNFENCNVTGKFSIKLKSVPIKHLTIKGKVGFDQEPSKHYLPAPFYIEAESSIYLIANFKMELSDDEYTKWNFPRSQRGAYKYRDALYATIDDYLEAKNSYLEYSKKVDWILDIREAELEGFYWRCTELDNLRIDQLLYTHKEGSYTDELNKHKSEKNY
jgi:hypothetical protein